MLERGGDSIALADWGHEIIEACRPIADTLDAAQGGSACRGAIEAAAAALRDPARLPSARVIGAMTAEHDGSHSAFVRAMSQRTRAGLLEAPFPAETRVRFDRMAQESIEAQRRIEAADTMPFEIYRQEYLAPRRLRV